MMKSQFFLAGALALAVVPTTLVLSGCGGGGGSTNAAPNFRFSRQSNVEFPDTPGVSGVLTVNFVDSAPNANAQASGTLQLYQTPVNTTATPQPFPDPPAGAENFLSVVPSNATYILVGNVVPANNNLSDITLDLRGSYQGSPRFTLRGDFVNGATISLAAKFERGDSVLRGRIFNVNNATIPSRPGTTTGATTTGATTTGATTTGTTTTGATTTGATTTGATTTGTTTTGATTTGATTTGATTTGATTTGATNAGGTTATTTAGLTMAGGTTAGGTTAGATTGSTTAGATTGGTSVGLPPSIP